MDPPNSAPPDHDEWICAAAACRLLSCAVTTIQRGAVLGLIRVRLEPGVPPRFNRADVVRYGESIGPKTGKQRSDPGRAGRRRQESAEV